MCTEVSCCCPSPPHPSTASSNSSPPSSFWEVRVQAELSPSRAKWLSP